MKKFTINNDVKANRYSKVIGICLLLVALMPSFYVKSQTTVNITPGTTTWTCPAGVTSITVECWGGGGKGGSRTSNGAGGGGGGGGYSRSVLTVVPTTVYNLSVGSGSSTTGAGGESWFMTAGTILARGGNSVADNITTGANGGAVGIGTFVFSGGRGSDVALSRGGGGGAAGGYSANGFASTTNTGATGAGVAGSGGDGKTGTQGVGEDGSAPGGGGGGAYRSTSNTRTGGIGGNGRVAITFVPQYASQIVGVTLGSATWCAGETRNVTVQIKNTGTEAWTDGPGGVPDFNIGVKWNTNGANWTDYYIRTDALNLAPGATGNYTLPITASNNIGAGYTTVLGNGINNLTFDIVYEGVSWFGGNGGVVGPGNSAFTSAPQTIRALPTPTFTARPGASMCTGSTTYSTATGQSNYIWSVPGDAGTDYNITAGGIGTGNSSVTLTWLTTGSKTVTVNYTTNGCSGATPASNTTVVGARPVVTTANTSSVCSGDITNIDLTADISSSTFTWTRTILTPTTGVGGGSASGSSDPIAQTLTNSNTSDRTVRYLVTPTASGCAGAQYQIDVLVHPKPVITGGQTKTICNNTDVNFTPALTAVVPSSFTWTVPTPGTITGYTQPVTVAATIHDQLINPSNAVNGSITYAVTARSTADDCPSVATNVTFTVKPTIEVTNVGPYAICSGGNPNIALTSSNTSANATTYGWALGSGGIGSVSGAGIGSGGTISQNITNSSNSIAAIVEYVVTPTVSGTPTCAGTSLSIMVKVNPVPVVTPGDKSICSGTSANINLISSAPSDFNWIAAAGTGSGITGFNSGSGSAPVTISDILTNPTDNTDGTVEYTVTATGNTAAVGACTSANTLITVTVTPTPTVTNGPTKMICNNSSVDIDLAGSVPSTFTWTIGAVSSPAISGYVANITPLTKITDVLVNTGTTVGTVDYNITPTSNAGSCPGLPYTMRVSVNPTATITSAGFGADPVCTATPVIPQNYTATSDVLGASFAWTRAAVPDITPATGSGNTAFITEVLTNGGPVQRAVRYVITPSINGCAGTPSNYDVTAMPRTDATILTTQADTAICNGAALSYYFTTSGTVDVAMPYKWSRVAISSINLGAGKLNQTTDPITEALTSTSSSIVPVIYSFTAMHNGCPGVVHSYTVSVRPTLSLPNQNIAACTGEQFVFKPSSASSGTIPSDTKFTWGLPTYNAAYISGGSAMATKKDSLQQTLTNLTSAVQNAIYTVGVSSASSCVGGSFALFVKLNPVLNVSVNTATDQYVCSGQTINPINSSTNLTALGAVLSWTRANTANLTGMAASGGSTITGSLINNSADTLLETFTVQSMLDSCIATTTIKVYVKPTPVINGLPTLQTALCSGTSPNTTITLSSNVTNTTFNWLRDNTANITGLPASGSTVADLSADLLLPAGVNSTQRTIFTITPEKGLCYGLPIKDTVFVKPIPQFTLNPTTVFSVCSSTSFGTIAINPSNSVAGTSYRWDRNNTSDVTGMADFEDNATSISGILKNLTGSDKTSQFTVTATADGCSSSKTIDITIKSQPILTISPATQNVCNNSALSISLSGGDSYSWTRTGGINISGISNSGTGPTISSASLVNSSSVKDSTVFTVQTLGSNGCATKDSSKVFVYATTVAPVIGDNQKICQNSIPVDINVKTAPLGGQDYVYSWFRATSAGGPWTPFAGNVPSISPTPNSATTYYYRLTVTYGTCGLPLNSTAVSVETLGISKSLSDLGANVPDSVCSGETQEITVVATLVDFNQVKYTWSANSTYITPGSGGAPSSTGFGLWYRQFDLTFANNTNALVTSNLTIYPKVYNAAGNTLVCDVKAEVFPVKIKPKPVALVNSTATSTQTICSGGAPSGTFKSNITDIQSDFTWSMTAPATITNSLGIVSGTNYNLTSVAALTNTTLASLCGTLTNGLSTKQTVTFIITPKSRNCTGSPITVTVYVKGKVDPGTNPQDVMICSAGDPAEFQPGAAIAGINPKYQWQRSSTAGCTTGFGNITGATGEFYDEVAGFTSARYYRRVVTDTTGGVSCAATPSTCIALTINNVAGGNLTLATQTVCLGNNPAEITGGTIIPSGAGTLSYQWQIFDGSNYVDIVDSTRSSLKPSVVTSSIFRRQVISTNTSPASTCIANSTNVANVYVNTVTAGDIDLTKKEYCGKSIPSKFLSINDATWNGTSFQYRWVKQKTDNCDTIFSTLSTSNNKEYTYTAQIDSNTLFKRVAISTLNFVQCTDTTECVKVEIKNISAGEIADNQAVCYNGIPQAFVSQEDAFSGGSIQYDWESSATGLPGDWTSLGINAATYTPTDPVTSSIYFRRSASDAVLDCKLWTPSVSIFVNNFTVGQVDVPSCNSLNPNAFILTDAATSSGGGLSYLWKKSDGDCSGDWSPATGINDDESYQPTNLPEGSHYYHRVVTSTLGTNSCTDTANCVLVKAYDGSIGDWKGIVSTDWFDCANWGSGFVPDNATPVNIPSAPFSPIINRTSSLVTATDKVAWANNLNVNDVLAFANGNDSLFIGGDLTIGSGGSVVMTNGGNLELRGHWTNNVGPAGFVQHSGNVSLTGASAQQHIITPQTFDRLRVNHTGAGITLDKDVIITDSIEFVNGKVNLGSPDGKLIFEPDAIATGANDNSFVNGPVSKETNVGNLNSDFIFPIGKGATYMPAGIRTVKDDGGIVTYTGEYFASDPANISGVILGTSALGVLQANNYWDIAQSGAGTGDSARVILYYENTSRYAWPLASPSPASTNIAVVHYNSPGYVNVWSFTRPDNGFEVQNAPYEAIPYTSTPLRPVYSGVMASFSPFTLAYGRGVVLPIKLISFDGRILGTDGALSWKIADASDLAGFELQYSADGSTFRKLADVPANGSTVYSYLDKQLPIGARYYRLLIKEKSGNSLFSKLLVLTLDGQRTSIVGLANTIVREQQVTGKIISAKSQGVRALVSDASGRQIKEQKGHLQQGTNRWLIGTGYLAQGMYFVTIITDDGVKATLQFVKE